MEIAACVIGKDSNPYLDQFPDPIGRGQFQKSLKHQPNLEMFVGEKKWE